MSGKVLFLIKLPDGTDDSYSIISDALVKRIENWWNGPYAGALILGMSPGVEIEVKQAGREILEDLPPIEVKYSIGDGEPQEILNGKEKTSD